MQHRYVGRYSVRQFGLTPFLKLGLFLGVAASLFPSLAATLIAMNMVSVLRRFLEGVKSVDKPLPMFNWHITFDFVDLLRLSGILESLQFIDSHAWLFGGGLFLMAVVVSSISLGVASLVVAIVYNVLAKTVGGLEIELEELSYSGNGQYRDAVEAVPGPSAGRRRPPP